MKMCDCSFSCFPTSHLNVPLQQARHDDADVTDAVVTLCCISVPQLERSFKVSDQPPQTGTANPKIVTSSISNGSFCQQCRSATPVQLPLVATPWMWFLDSNKEGFRSRLRAELCCTMGLQATRCTHRNCFRRVVGQQHLDMNFFTTFHIIKVLVASGQPEATDGCWPMRMWFAMLQWFKFAREVTTRNSLPKCFALVLTAIWPFCFLYSRTHIPRIRLNFASWWFPSYDNYQPAKCNV